MKRVIFLIFIVLSFNAYSATIFVNDNASGANNGSSWADAYQSFQLALDAAQSGDQIWVASGTYKPSYDYGLGIGSRGNHFRMKPGVAIYGGFAGTETEISQRTNFGVGGANQTILSGDIGSIGVNADNCLHIFYHPSGLGLNSTAVLDGFNIIGGYAFAVHDALDPRQSGGGIFNDASSPTISNCTISGNYAYSDGGGIYNANYSSPIISNCIISNNDGYYGGGIYNDSNSSPIINKCTISNNYGRNVGGGVYNFAYCSPVISNCTIYGNYTWQHGGGVFFDRNCSPIISNCTIYGNSSSASYGGGVYIYDGSPQIINCTIYGNYAANSGGGVYMIGCVNANISNSIIWDNNAGSGKQLYIVICNATTINYSCYSNGSNDAYIDPQNYRYVINVSNIISINPKFVNPAKGDFRIFGTSPCVDAGSNSYIGAITTDIRGVDFSRNLNKNNGQSGTVDLGAYEYKYGVDPAIKIVYVNDDADGANNGTSWADAFTSFQSALDAVVRTDQIRVAKGTYKPSKTYTSSTTPNPVRYHFRMIPGVEIYGGFAGTETDIGQRTDFGAGGANETILSGDLNNDDIVTGAGATLAINNVTANCQHVFYHPDGINLTSDAILDGFTISGGRATLFIGMEYQQCSGAGFLNVNSSPTIRNCTFSGNYASAGSAIYNLRSSPTVSNCIFKYNFGASIITNRDCSPIFNNCLVTANKGCLIANNDGSTRLTNCTISGNDDDNHSVIYNGGTSILAINNSIIWNNTTQSGIQYQLTGGTVTLNNSCYSNTDGSVLIESATFNTTNNNITSNPKFVNTNIGDYRLCGTSPCVNAGSNQYIAAPYLILTTDIRGNDFGRNLNKNSGESDTVDIGAYEYKFGTDPATMTIHVNDNAEGLNNGSNWTDALISLQSALDIASTGDQIWAAKGIYKPSSAYDLTNNSKYYHFRMKKGVEMYGGFAGTETDESQRTDYGAGGVNETILSGDLNGDDIINGSGATLSLTNNSDNCYHVFYHPQGLGLANTDVLNGFTISGGNADETSPHNAGAAVFNSYNSPTIINCQIMNNNANTGAGLYNSNSSTLVSDCKFNNNYSIQGSAVNNISSSPIINNCIIFNNKATSYAGAISNVNSTNLVNNCTIYGNASNYGGAFYHHNTTLTITNCKVYGNIATNQGGAIFNSAQNLIINNSILWGNNSSSGKQIFNSSGTTTLNYSCYSNVGSDISGTLTATNNNITTNPRFVDPTAGDFRIDGSSNCVDAGNDAYCTELYDIRGNGYDRKLNKSNGESGRIDIGAYEYKLATDPLAQSMIIYVNDDASGTNNGMSWTNAFTSFQSALDYAIPGDKIWVAGGTYKPNSAYNLTNTSRYYHFRMKHGVEIYGGFAGIETDTSQRTNYKAGGANETILSGDIGTIGNYTDNCYHVFYHPYELGLTNADIIDGITIKDGYAQHYMNLFSSGGGMYNSHSSPTISNCIISTNNGGGGAIHNDGCQAIIINSEFCNNIVYPISNKSCSPTIVKCKFYNNASGAIYNEDASPAIIDCEIYNNGNSSMWNGIIYNLGSSPLIQNCRFYGNSSCYGGAVHNISTSNPIIRNCMIYNNYGTYGGAIYNMTSNPQIINSIIYGNNAGAGGFLYNELRSSPQVINCTIYGNNASAGGAVYNYYNSNSTFSINNSIIWGNTATIGKQFYDYGSCITILNHCCYSNSAGDLSVGSGFNASNDCNSYNPRFVDAENHDFTLKGYSPCVNSGDLSYNSLNEDFRGEQRVQGKNIDMGAYEWTSGIDPDPYPNTQASNLQFSNITRTGMNISWTRGTGEACLLLVRQQLKIPAEPLVDDENYPSSNDGVFTNTQNPTVAGAKVLYNGSDENPTVSITGLSKFKLYYYRVFEYNGDPSFEKYLQTTSTNNPSSRWTLRRDDLAEEDLSIDTEYPYPNPVSNSINTTLDVFDAGNITAYLFDNSGRQIAELYNHYHEFGTYELKFDLSQIAQGTYQLVINKGSEAVVYPISVVR